MTVRPTGPAARKSAQGDMSMVKIRAAEWNDDAPPIGVRRSEGISDDDQKVALSEAKKLRPRAGKPSVGT